jgi:hypothetical protein
MNTIGQGIWTPSLEILRASNDHDACPRISSTCVLHSPQNTYRSRNKTCIAIVSEVLLQSPRKSCCNLLRSSLLLPRQSRIAQGCLKSLKEERRGFARPEASLLVLTVQNHASGFWTEESLIFQKSRIALSGFRTGRIVAIFNSLDDAFRLSDWRTLDLFNVPESRSRDFGLRTLNICKSPNSRFRGSGLKNPLFFQQSKITLPGFWTQESLTISRVQNHSSRVLDSRIPDIFKSPESRFQGFGLKSP